MGVVGHVGAGKSSLIQALLGEMDKLAGNVQIKVQQISDGQTSILGVACCSSTVIPSVLLTPSLVLYCIATKECV